MVGAIDMQASVRPEAKLIIEGLRQRGIKHIAIVSGDHKQPTQKLPEELIIFTIFFQKKRLRLSNSYRNRVNQCVLWEMVLMMRLL